MWQTCPNCQQMQDSQGGVIEAGLLWQGIGNRNCDGRHIVDQLCTRGNLLSGT
jgi:hypothetical protein